MTHLAEFAAAVQSLGTVGLADLSEAKALARNSAIHGRSRREVGAQGVVAAQGAGD
jgi:hypothetical protein